MCFLIFVFQRNNAKKDGEKNSGGGKAGIDARKGGDMAAEMEKAQKARAEVEKKRAEKAAKK